MPVGATTGGASKVGVSIDAGAASAAARAADGCGGSFGSSMSALTNLAVSIQASASRVVGSNPGVAIEKNAAPRMTTTCIAMEIVTTVPLRERVGGDA